MLSVFKYMVSECTSNIIFYYCCFITAESHRVQMKLVWKYLKNVVLQWPAGGNFYECKNGSYRKEVCEKMTLLLTPSTTSVGIFLDHCFNHSRQTLFKSKWSLHKNMFPYSKNMQGML